MTMTSTGDRVFIFTPTPPRVSEWDASAGEANKVRDWMTSGRVYSGLSLSSDERYLLAAGGFRILLISLETNEIQEWTVKDQINACTWHPNGRQFATAHIDGSISLWSVDSDQSTGKLLGHSSLAFELAWHPDGRRLASSSGDQTVKIWDTESQDLVLTLDGHKGETRGVAWSPDGRILATTSLDGAIRLWDGSAAYELEGRGSKGEGGGGKFSE